ncbi:MAG: hypothetical protein GYB64_11805, partial [Chloroflexi bacterium]|nr:hypothetical protein [Chloroflexota bacterium]
MKRLLPFFLVASALACGVLQPETVEEVATQPAAAQPTQTTAAPTPTPDPLAACPQPGPDQQQVINEAGGYCLLVPAGMTLNANWNSYNTAADVVYTGDVLYPDGPESPSALVEVNVIGAPGIVTELTLSDYINNLAGPMGPFTVEGETTLGGQDAVIVIEPGMFALRGVYTLHNNTLYTLRTLPPDAGEGTPVDTTAIYELASRSFTFFTPQFDDEVRTPRDVCPEPVEGETQVFISLMDGICYLMPADFMPEAAASNWYVGGPDLGDVWPGSPSQVFIAA